MGLLPPLPTHRAPLQGGQGGGGCNDGGAGGTDVSRPGEGVSRPTRLAACMAVRPPARRLACCCTRVSMAEELAGCRGFGSLHATRSPAPPLCVRYRPARQTRPGSAWQPSSSLWGGQRSARARMTAAPVRQRSRQQLILRLGCQCVAAVMQATATIVPLAARTMGREGRTVADGPAHLIWACEYTASFLPLLSNSL